MDRYDTPVGNVLNDFRAFCDKSIDYNGDDNSCCDKCALMHLAEELKVHSCFELLIQKPKEFLNIIYPKSLKEEIHEHFPNARIDSLCVADILGITYDECVCKKYNGCREHFALTKEEILKESKHNSL